MSYVLFGIRQEELSLREKVSFTNTKKLKFYTLLQEQGITSALILSTCNRSQIFVCDKREHLLCELYANFFQISDVYVQSVSGNEALYQLFRIATGLDSEILGEDQILHQMKKAYEFAIQTQMCDTLMHLIMQEVFRFAKSMHRAYHDSSYSCSTSHIAAQILKQKLRSKQRCLCVGMGAMIKELLPYLFDLDLEIIIMTRNPQKLASNTTALKAIVSFEKRWYYFNWADCILCATSSPHLIFPYEKQVKKGNKILFDFAVPRDIDPRFKEIYEVYDIDDIQHYQKEHQQRQLDYLSNVERNIEIAYLRLLKKLKKQNDIPYISEMKQSLERMSSYTYGLLNEQLTLQKHEQRTMKKTLDYAFHQYLKQFLQILEHASEEEKNFCIKLCKEWKEDEKDAD